MPQTAQLSHVGEDAFIQEILAYAASFPLPSPDRAAGVADGKGCMTIPLGGGKFALIDEEDYPLVRRYSWSLSSDGRYAIASGQRGTRQRKTILHRMHRLISMAGPNSLVDHRNGNGLDNRADNLRICTAAQNGWNSRISSANTSGVKGVALEGGRWRVRIIASGALYTKALGTIEEAKEWAASTRAAVHGEFANDGGYETQVSPKSGQQ